MGSHREVVRHAPTVTVVGNSETVKDCWAVEGWTVMFDSVPVMVDVVVSVAVRFRVPAVTKVAKKKVIVPASAAVNV